MRLQRLTGLEIEKIEAEASDLKVKITDYKEIIGSHDRKINIIKEELSQIKAQYKELRMSEINLYED